MSFAYQFRMHDTLVAASDLRSPLRRSALRVAVAMMLALLTSGCVSPHGPRSLLTVRPVVWSSEDANCLDEVARGVIFGRLKSLVDSFAIWIGGNF